MHAVEGALQLKKTVGCIKCDKKHYTSFENSRGNEALLESGKVLPLLSKQSIASFVKLCNERKPELGALRLF